MIFLYTRFREGMCMVILWYLYLVFPKNKNLSLFLIENSIKKKKKEKKTQFPLLFNVSRDLN